MTLWRDFEHLENLEDAFLSFKKNRGGNRFSFIKLSNVHEPDLWIEKLKEIRIDGAIINVNLALFNRDGSKVEKKFNGERVSVFDRLGKGIPEIQGNQNVRKETTVQGVNSHPSFGGRSYCSVLKNQKFPVISMDRLEVALPPMNTDSKKNMEYKSLVGETKDIEILNNLKDTLEEGMADNYLRLRVNKREQWFSRLYMWDGIPLVFDRVAWIKVLGVPVSLWDRHVLNKIGKRCGRLLVKFEASFEDGNMAEDRMAILIGSGKRLSEEVTLMWKEHKLTVWVEEIAGQWCPDFLQKSKMNDDEVSSIFGDESRRRPVRLVHR
ncbi:hypothetical protein Hanom_Chr17g01584471 [Helianthus anomalus]